MTTREDPDKTIGTPAPSPTTAEGIDPHLSAEGQAHARALADSYTKYVAVMDIPKGNVLAYAEGDPVPVENVKRWKYDEQGFAAKRDSAAGKAALDRVAARSPSTVKAPGDD